MAYRFVTRAMDGAVATIAIARPDKLNALTPNVFAELTDAIDASVAQGARALVLTGEGRAFCSGADLQADGAGYEGLPDDLGELIDACYNPFTRKLMALPVPVITAVNGPAVGAGMGLALTGDITVAARSAYFLPAFVNIGLVPDAGTSWLVAASVGRARAMEMALLGERIDAEQARAIGLIARVADDGAALSDAQAIAARLAAGPGMSIARIRRQINVAVESTLAETLEIEREHQRECGFSDDFREAIAAFAEKRKPQFKGR